jgi:hypothetical protein
MRSTIRHRNTWVRVYAAFFAVDHLLHLAAVYVQFAAIARWLCPAR